MPGILHIFPLKDHRRPLWALKVQPYSKTVVTYCHDIPGMAFDYSDKLWVGYPDALEALAENLRYHGLQPDDRKLVEFMKQPLRDHVFLPARKSRDDDKARDYQVEGVDFLLSTAPYGGSILADVMGLGKTMQATLTLRAFNGRALIVCPSAARPVWCDPERGEVARWWPKAKIFQPVGTKPWTGYRYPNDQTPAIPPGVNVVVIHFDILHAWVPVLLRWGPSDICVDEIQMIQSAKSRRSKSLKEVSRGPSTNSRFGLSGTPVLNYLQDFWNVVDLISPGVFIKNKDGQMEMAPRFGRTFYRYGMRYCDGHYVLISRDIGEKPNFDGTSHEEELEKRLRHFVLRRTKEEVKLQLPTKTRQVIRLEVPMQFRQTAVAKIDARIIQALMTKAVDMMLQRGEPFDLVGDHLAGGNSVVVFTVRQLVAEHFVNEMSARGFFARFIHGGIDPAKRQGILNELRARAEAEPVMLAATIDTMGVAIDLTFAQVALFAELPYEPHKILQAEDRLHRFPQRDPVLIQFIIGIGTILEYICEVVIDRLGTVKKLGLDRGELEATLSLDETDILKELGDRLMEMA